MADGAAPVVEMASEGAVGPVLLPDFVGESRPAGEYSGYTYDHLPNCPKNTDAIPASFAARIAFSSLRIR